MNASVDSQAFLDALSRFEKQVGYCRHRSDCVNLFCMQIIPFLKAHTLIAPLRAEWSKKYQALLLQAEFSAKEALNEVKNTFFELVSALTKGNKQITDKIVHIQRVLSGDPAAGVSSWPLCQVAYFEVKELLQMVLESGKKSVCEQYAVLRKARKAFTQAEGDPKVIEELVIDHYTFAPTVQVALEVSKAVLWDQLQNPAVVWRYLEIVLWYWNTSRFYFETAKKSVENSLQSLNEKSAWLEIGGVRNGFRLDHPPVIFTNQFFREGMQTLINEIMVFVSNGCRIEEGQDNSLDKMIFELQLEENRLYVLIYTDSSEPEKCHLKRFNNEAMGGSKPYDFIKNLSQKHPQGGDIEVPLESGSDSIPKLIDRLGIPKPLQSLFFGRSRGNRVFFNGMRVAIDRDEKCRNLLEELNA